MNRGSDSENRPRFRTMHDGDRDHDIPGSPAVPNKVAETRLPRSNVQITNREAHEILPSCVSLCIRRHPCTWLQQHVPDQLKARRLKASQAPERSWLLRMD
jgi:hypothetical protein